MKIFSIALKEIKRNLRNKFTLSIMIIFPVVLIWILGMALGGFMDNEDFKFENINVLYNIEEENNISDSFDNLIKIFEEMDIKTIEIKNVDEGKEMIGDGKAACFIYMQGTDIKIIKNERMEFEAGFVQSIFYTFIQRYNAIDAIKNSDPIKLKDILEEDNVNEKYIEIQSINKKNKPRALDYYGITMLNLIIMYASIIAANAIKGEKTMRTGSRIFTTPISGCEIFLGKLIGALFTIIIQMSIVITVSMFVYKVNYGEDIAAVFAIIGTLIIMAASLGLFIASIVKKDEAIEGILQIVIVIISFLGGAYIPLETFGSTLSKVGRISPIAWTNKAIFNVIYSGDYSKFFIAIAINFLLAIAFLAVASKKIIKKEAF